ncbi:tail fiber protein [Mesorhizobium sp. BE184]|uniref:phage tail protein n=1 Tax=Mesorhizobium sp. BE184 TaxID=2817714 RepID=UPI0028602919|nr:tail fiber protein [Mesorhizobium sp. BE184]MDR7032440.1 microcystin-dependent protein [Mesorhizobium sp. BE184]
MPRDSNANYSLPPGYLAVTGQNILASQHNPPLEDIAQALTGSVPRNGSGAMLANLPMGDKRITGLADGTAATDAATKGQVDSAAPIGMVADFAGTDAPSGWLLCYGQAVSRSAYASLFTVIGTTYGAGDGTTTFNIPKCNGRTRVGKDNMGGTDAGVLSTFYGSVARTLGGILGTASHVLLTGQLPKHKHEAGTLSAASAGAHTHTVPNASSQTGGNGGAGSSPTGTITTSSAGAHTHDVEGDTAEAGNNEAHPNAQPSIVFNVIIKAF